MLALLCVAFTFTSCSDNEILPEDDPSKGSKDNPYTVAEAIDAVKDLTWTSNTTVFPTSINRNTSQVRPTLGSATRWSFMVN